MKFFLVISILFANIIFAESTNTVLESSLKENSLSADAILVMDTEPNSKDVFLSYNNDLLIITVRNAMMVKKQSYPKTSDKRILRTLVHSPNLNRIDYRIRFQNAKLVKPELNEIIIKKNKIIVKLFKSQKDMLLFHLQEKNSMKTTNTPPKKAVIQKKPTPIQKVVTKTQKAVVKTEKPTSLQKDNTPKNPKEKKALIASPAPTSFNSTMFMILLFLGAVAFYLKKRNGNVTLPNNEGVKIISTKSLGNKKQLIMVEANGNKLLLATSENGVQVLSGLENSSENDNNELEYTPKNKKNKSLEENTFKTELDEEIDELERSFFQKKARKNPYIQDSEPEVVTHFSKKLKNIRKL